MARSGGPDRFLNQSNPGNHLPEFAGGTKASIIPPGVTEACEPIGDVTERSSAHALFRAIGCSPVDEGPLSVSPWRLDD